MEPAIRDIVWIAILTFCIEGITVFFRFACGYRSREVPARVRKFTGGIRVHHGYVGFFVLIIAGLISMDDFQKTWLFRAGWGLLLSDLIHHFVVLKAVTGDAEFDLTYPIDRA